MIKKSLSFVVIILLLVECVPPTNEVITDVELNYQDTEQQDMYSLIDRQEVDSILLYTNHPDPAFRYLIGKGLASIQGVKGIDSLKVLLNDPVSLVRAQAAYALGQISDPSTVPLLVEAFVDKDTLDVNNITNCQVLEAIGKSGDAGLLQSLATVSSYRVTDTLLLLGQTRAIYRYALRGITTPEATDLMIEYAADKKYPQEVRLMAANYLSRAKDIILDDYKFRITEAMQNEEDVNIKMALAASLRKINDKDIFELIKTEFGTAEDYRYKVNLLRTMKSFNYISAIEPNLENLGNSNLHIASTAAEYLITNGNRSDAIIYRNFIADTLHWDVKAKLYSAILKYLPVYYARTKNILKNEIQTLYAATNNDYEKAAYITALSYNPQNYTLMKELGFAGSPVLKSAAMGGLERIIQSENFIQTFRGGYRNVKRQITDFILEGVQSGDVGMLAIAGTIIKNPKNEMRDYITDYSVLEEALDKLELPRDIETYNELGAAVAYLKDETFTPAKAEFSHPIDWQVLSTVSDSTLVNIRTSKGLITAILYKDEAPGSVANFTQLCNDNFYSGKVFHRVVPNFVIQTGCPRGDGYGSLDYTIRSELSSMYYNEEGYLGMASAGKDTESTQWFITHSPTPHLDGKYTIFGKVTRGMDVVHAIQVGDTIEDIIFSKK